MADASQVQQFMGMLQNWSTQPPDVQERLTRAGFGPWERLGSDVQERLSRGAAISQTDTATTTTPHPTAEGLGSAAFATAVAPLGPAASIGAGGVGGVLTRAAVEGRMPTPTEALKAYARGSGGEAAGQGTSAVLSRLGRAVGIGRPLSEANAAIQRAGEHFRVPLSAGDVTLSKPTRMIENFPSYFAIGSGPVQAFRERQLGAAGQAAERLLTPGAQESADQLTAGLVAQGGVKNAIQAFRAQSQRLFDEVEALAGPEPVVPTTNIQEVATRLLERAEGTVQPAVAAARRLAPTGGITGIPELDDELLSVAGADKIPFATARRIESQLGQLAFRGRTAPIGTIQQGELAALYRAVRSDLDSYLETPAAGDVAPALAEAKQAYATGRALFNQSMGPIVLGSRRSPVRPEKVLERVFRPGAVTDTLDFKLAVSDDVYQQAVAAWKQRLYEDAFAHGSFSPARFASAVAKYERKGHLDAILPPAEAAEFRSLANLSTRLGTAERIAGNPSGTGQAILSSQQLEQLIRHATAGLLSGAGAGVGAYEARQRGQSPWEGAVTGAVAPWAIGRAALSGPGIRLLTNGVGPALIAGGSRLAGQGVSQTWPAVPDLLKSLREGPPTP